jgi:hypothetical protein
VVCCPHRATERGKPSAAKPQPKEFRACPPLSRSLPKRPIEARRLADSAGIKEQIGPPPAVIWLTCGNTSNAALRILLKDAQPKHSGSCEM